MEWYSGWITSRCLVSAGKERAFILDLRFGVITNQRTHTLHIIQLSQSSLSTCAKLFLSCLFTTPGSITHQDPLSMGFSRQEYWSRLPFPPPGDLLDPEIKPTSPAASSLQADYCWATESLTKLTTLIIIILIEVIIYWALTRKTLS